MASSTRHTAQFLGDPSGDVTAYLALTASVVGTKRIVIGPAPDGVAIDGTGDYISTPDAAAWTISGVMRVIVRVNLADYSSAFGVLWGHWHSTLNQRSWLFRINTSGSLRFTVSTNGTSNLFDTSSGAAGLVDGTEYWLGVEYNTATGALAFYKADAAMDPPRIWTDWTLISSSTVAAGVPFDANVAMTLGATAEGTAPLSAGTIYRGELWDDGALVAAPDFTRTGNLTAHLGDTVATDLLGNVWTLQGDAAVLGLTVVQPFVAQLALAASAAGGKAVTGGTVVAFLALTASAVGAPPSVVIVTPVIPIEDIISLVGIAQRAEGIRFDVLDQTLSKIGEVTPISDMPARIRNSETRTIRRSLEGMRLTPADAAAINPLTDRIRPMWVIRDLAGTDHAFPMGVFLFGENPAAVYSWGNETTATMIDQGYILDQASERAWGFSAGTPVAEALAEVFADVAGITTPVIDPGLGSLTGDMAFPVGTRRTKIIDDLLLVGGGLPHYFDNEGTPRCRTLPDLGIAVPAFTYTTDGSSVIDKDSIVTYDDLLDAPNRYMVIGGSSDAEIVGYYDIPSDAEHSIAQRGFAVTRVETLQSVQDASQATAAALALYASDNQTFAWAEFDAVTDPRHDTFDIVAYTGPIFIGSEWSAVLETGGKMHHVLRRLYV